MSVSQQFINKARLCSPQPSAVMKDSLEFEKHVKQPGNVLHFTGQKVKAHTFNSELGGRTLSIKDTAGQYFL